MVRVRRTAITLSLGLVIGALVGGLAVHLTVSNAEYHGIPAPLLDQSYFYNHGTVGPAQIFSGVWIDGFEESRFFPDARALPTDHIPQTTARLLIDDASRNLIHRFMARALEPGCSDVLAITFKGNVVRPNHGIGLPGYIETIYVPSEVFTVTQLRRIC